MRVEDRDIMGKVGHHPWAAAAATVASLVASAAQADTVGAGLVNRGNTDGAQGNVFALNTPFADAGVLESWSFYNSSAATYDVNGPDVSGAAELGYLITPLLLSDVAGDYTIIGVGAAQADTGDGVQTYGFGLVSGTAVVAPGDVFGWFDGSSTTANAGVVAFDFTSGGPTEQYFVNSTTGSLHAGSDLGAGAVLDRTYSIQATAAVPEPSVWTMLLIGFGGLGPVLRRSRSVCAMNGG
jgi:hypothetical protein